MQKPNNSGARSGALELAIVLRGDLAAILRFAANKKNPDVLSEAGVLGALLSQESLVAGTRNHLDLLLSVAISPEGKLIGALERPATLA